MKRRSFPLANVNLDIKGTQQRSADDRSHYGHITHLVGLSVVILCQRLAVPVGNSVQLPLSAFAGVLFACVGLYLGYLRTSRMRLVLCASSLSIFLLSIGLTLNNKSISYSSIVAVIVIYISLVPTTPSKGNLLPVFWFHQKLILILGLLGTLQFLLQFAKVPLFDPFAFLPESFVMQGFNTLQPLSFGLDIMKSNGCFYLEASHFSKSLAVAMVIEIIYFRRPYYMATYSIAYLTTFSGTGLLAFICGILFIPKERRPRLGVVFGAYGFVVIAVVVGALGFSGFWTDRLHEFTTPGTSAYERFVSPYQAIWNFANSRDVFVGRGPGSVAQLEAGDVTNGEESYGVTFVKVGYEYGLIALAVFGLFIIFVFLWRPPVTALGVSAFVVYAFLTGAFIEPATVYYCYLISAVFAGSAATTSGRKDNVADFSRHRAFA